MLNNLSDIVSSELNRTLFFSSNNVYAIGDVHGCGREFESLILKILEFDSSAAFFQVGDLIDRGPDFFRVFDICDRYNVRTTIGNHELKFYSELTTKRPCRSKARRVSHEKFSMLSTEEQEIVMRRIVNSPSYYEVVVDGVMTHISHSPLELHMKRYQYAHPSDACMTNEPHHPVPNNVHGHMSWDYIDIYEQIEHYSPFKPINIDSGCVYGGPLIALRLNDLRVFGVSSKKYAERH